MTASRGAPAGEHGKPWRRRLASGAVLVLLGLVLWGYVVGPLVSTFRRSISTGGGMLAEYAPFLDFGSVQSEAMRGSLMISILTVITSGTIGVFLAVLLNRWDFRFRKIFQAMVLVPIALPPLMGVKAFYLLYGKAGTFPQLLGQLFHSSPTAFALTGMSGVLLVHTLTMYPYFYLSVAASLAQADDSLEEAAYSLGASKFQTWSRVLLPMLTPPIVAGALLTFMSSMASYTAPLLFEVNNVMTVQIVNNAANQQSLAAAVSVTLAVISVIFLVVIRGYEGRSVYRTQSKGGARKRRWVTSPLARMTLTTSALLSTIVLILPIAMIFLLAFSENFSWRTAPLPSSYTLQNFVRLFSDSDYWGSGPEQPGNERDSCCRSDCSRGDLCIRHRANEVSRQGGDRHRHDAAVGVARNRSGVQPDHRIRHAIAVQLWTGTDRDVLDCPAGVLRPVFAPDFPIHGFIAGAAGPESGGSGSKPGFRLVERIPARGAAPGLERHRRGSAPGVRGRCGRIRRDDHALSETQIPAVVDCHQ